MHVCDKSNGTKTILRLNEAVSKRSRSNSISKSNTPLIDSSIMETTQLNMKSTTPTTMTTSTMSSQVAPISSAKPNDMFNSTQTNQKNSLNHGYSYVKPIAYTVKQPTSVRLPASRKIESTNSMKQVAAMAASVPAASIASRSTTMSTQNVPGIANYSVEDKNVKFIIEFMAGAFGGALSRTATAPIDRLRTMLQVNSVELNPNSPNLTVSSVWRYMLIEGKWPSLWRGNMVNVLKTAPENAIRMASYEKLKALMRAHRNDNAPLGMNDKFLCGSFAGLFATLALYPLKTIKTIMNIGNTGEYKSIVDCIHQTFRRHGIRAFYRGLLVNSAAIMPSTGIDLAIYETLKKNYNDLTNKSESTILERLFFGNVSSCVGNFFVYPLLFARTRLQSNRNPNETTFKILVHVVNKDGFAGMYRGFLLHILKIGPAASISYVTFEMFTKAFNLNSLN